MTINKLFWGNEEINQYYVALERPVFSANIKI